MLPAENEVGMNSLVAVDLPFSPAVRCHAVGVQAGVRNQAKSKYEDDLWPSERPEAGRGVVQPSVFEGTERASRMRIPAKGISGGYSESSVLICISLPIIPHPTSLIIYNQHTNSCGVTARDWADLRTRSESRS